MSSLAYLVEKGVTMTMWIFCKQKCVSLLTYPIGGIVVAAVHAEDSTMGAAKAAA